MAKKLRYRKKPIPRNPFEMSKEELTEAQLEKERKRAESAEESKRTQEALKKNVSEAIPDAALGVVQGLSLDALPEVGGFFKGAYDSLSGGDFSEGYEEGYEAVKEPFDKAQKRSPFAFGAGDIAGSIPASMAGAGAVSKGLKISRPLANMATAGAEGFLRGEGAEERALMGAGTAAMAGGAEALGKVLGLMVKDPQAIEMATMGVNKRAIKKSSAGVGRTTKIVKQFRDYMDNLRNSGFFSKKEVSFNPNTGKWEPTGTGKKVGVLGPSNEHLVSRLEDAKDKINVEIKRIFEEADDSFSFHDLPKVDKKEDKILGYDTNSVVPTPVMATEVTPDTPTLDSYKDLFTEKNIKDFAKKSGYSPRKIERIGNIGNIKLEDAINSENPIVREYASRYRPKLITEQDLLDFKTGEGKNIDILFHDLKNSFPEGESEAVDALFEKEMDNLFGKTEGVEKSRRMETSVRRLQDRKQELYEELDSKFSSGKFGPLEAKFKRKMANAYKKVLDVVLPEMRKYNKALGDIHKIYESASDLYMTEATSDLLLPQGAVSPFAASRNIVDYMMDPTRTARAKIGRELEKPVGPFKQPVGEYMKAVPRETGAQLIDQASPSGREPQSVDPFEGLEYPDISKPDMEILRARLPRSTQAVMENVDLFLDKLRYKNSNDYDEFMGILEAGNQEEIAQYLKFFSKENPNFFEFDKYGKFDGEIPVANRVKLIEDIMDRSDIGYTQKSLLIDKLNRTGRVE